MHHCSVLKLECALTTNTGKYITGINTLALQIKNKEFTRKKYIHYSPAAKDRTSASFK
jgi:hypothetical protein